MPDWPDGDKKARDAVRNNGEIAYLGFYASLSNKSFSVDFDGLRTDSLNLHQFLSGP